jgi:hypothetical protein
MKRLSVIPALIILAAWVILGAMAASPAEAKRANTPKHSGCVTVFVADADVKIAPVFDATGSVVSDPTGALVNANQYGCVTVLLPDAEMKIAPVFDDTGAIVSDPTGTILSVITP